MYRRQFAVRPAFGHVGPQPPENPAVQPPSQFPQIADTEILPPAPKHRIQQGHKIIDAVACAVLTSGPCLVAPVRLGFLAAGEVLGPRARSGIPRTRIPP